MKWLFSPQYATCSVFLLSNVRVSVSKSNAPGAHVKRRHCELPWSYSEAMKQWIICMAWLSIYSLESQETMQTISYALAISHHRCAQENPSHRVLLSSAPILHHMLKPGNHNCSHITMPLSQPIDRITIKFKAFIANAAFSSLYISMSRSSFFRWRSESSRRFCNDRTCMPAKVTNAAMKTQEMELMAKRTMARVSSIGAMTGVPEIVSRQQKGALLRDKIGERIAKREDS